MANDSQPEVVVRRAYQIYLYAVCFVTIVVVLFAAAEAVYGLVRIIIPGTTGGGTDFSTFRGAGSERDQGVAALIRNLILGGAAAAIFVFHWKRSGEARAELERAMTPPEPEPEPEAAPKKTTRRRPSA